MQGLRDSIKASEDAHAATVLAIQDTLRPALASLQAQKQQLLNEQTERQKDLAQLQVGEGSGAIVRVNCFITIYQYNT